MEFRNLRQPFRLALQIWMLPGVISGWVTVVGSFPIALIFSKLLPGPFHWRDDGVYQPIFDLTEDLYFDLPCFFHPKTETFTAPHVEGLRAGHMITQACSCGKVHTRVLI